MMITHFNVMNGTWCFKQQFKQQHHLNVWFLYEHRVRWSSKHASKSNRFAWLTTFGIVPLWTECDNRSESSFECVPLYIYVYVWSFNVHPFSMVNYKWQTINLSITIIYQGVKDSCLNLCTSNNLRYHLRPYIDRN